MRTVVGMSIEEIRRKKAETREERDKAADALASEVKARKQKQLQAKKAEKAKMMKNQGQNVQKAVKNVRQAKR